MRSIHFLITIAFLSAEALGHTMFTHFHYPGKAGDVSCVRRPPNTNPILDLASASMACNVGADSGGKVTGKCNVKAGDSIGFEWRTDPNIPAKDYPLKSTPRGNTPIGVIDDSHKGPCAVYLKKVDNSATAQGSGDGWFKIFEQTLVDGVFCTDILRLNNAIQTVTLPKSIANGDYLVRTEILTLNNAGSRSIGGQEEPQFYVGCAQITVTGGSGNADPSTVSIPGYVNKNTPGLIFDIWNSPNGLFNQYPSFGPPVFKDSNGSNNLAPPQTSTTSSPVPTTTSTSSVLAPAPTTLTTSTITITPSQDSTTSTVVPSAETSATSTVNAKPTPTPRPGGDGPKNHPPDWHPDPWKPKKPYWGKHWGGRPGQWWKKGPWGRN